VAQWTDFGKTLLVLTATASGLGGSQERIDLLQWLAEQELSSVKRLQHERNLTWALHAKLHEVASADWLTDERWPRPSPNTLALATQIIDAVVSTYPDAAPHVVTSPEGEIVFEWWNGPKKVTLYVGEDSLSYVKSWGDDMLEEMEDGVIQKASEAPSLLTWLLAE
jgi:hypothetical protein